MKTTSARDDGATDPCHDVAAVRAAIEASMWHSPAFVARDPTTGHEFGHDFSLNHLSGTYHRALCTIAHRMRGAAAVEAGVMAAFFAARPA